MPAPLAHLRVLDLTDLRGALAGRILADLGAEVLKVEPPGGDPGRLRPPFAGGVVAADRSLSFLYRNANKRSVQVDLGGPEGRARLDQLSAGADLLIENLGADARGSLGLGPGEIAVRHPELVHVAIADFGLSGPRAAWTAEPLCALAASGALYAAGFPDLPPCSLPGYLAHDCASIYAVAGALAALADRAESKAGQIVEISVQEAALGGLNPVVDPARGLRAAVPDASRGDEAKRRRALSGDQSPRRISAGPPRDSAALEEIRRMARQSRSAPRSGVGLRALPDRQSGRDPAHRFRGAFVAEPR